MFLYQYPTFMKGRILKKEMLENLRDYPRSFIQVQFQEHSDGIITGSHVEVEKDFLVVSSGMIKHDGRVYILENDYRLPYHATDKETVLKIVFKEEDIRNDFILYESKIFLDENLRLRSNERELCRFKLKAGATLRSDYCDFYDFATEYNTVNIINVEYAGFGKSTYNPIILRYFAKEILKHNSVNPYDIMFAMQCMNQIILDKESLFYYITNRLGLSYEEYSNIQIHKYLGLILKNVKGENKIRSGSRHGGFQKLIVD